MPDDEPPKNPFVRWKKHVDDRIGAGLNSILGIPSILSKNLHLTSSTTTTPPPPSSQTPNHDSTSPPSDTDSIQQLRRLPLPHAHSPSTMRPFPFNPAAQSALSDLSSIIHGPYTPINLDQHLPPPVPRDVPSDLGLDPESSFTYRDAFEDLLRVSTGLPLTPFSVFAARRSPVYHSFGVEGGEAPLDWLTRITADGLIARVLEQASQRRGDEERLEERADPFPALTAQWRETGNPFRTVAGNTFGREDAGREDERDEFPSGLFAELNRAVRMLDQIFGDAKATETGRHASYEEDCDECREKTVEAPDTEDELYETVRALGGTGSLTALVRAAMAAAEDRTPKSAPWTSEASIRDEDVVGTRTVRTTEDFTDEDGTHHVKVVTQRLNAQGEEVSRETHHTIRSGPKSRRVVDEADSEKRSDRTPESSAVDQHRGTTSGWFWK